MPLSSFLTINIKFLIQTAKSRFTRLAIQTRVIAIVDKTLAVVLPSLLITLLVTALLKTAWTAPCIAYIQLDKVCLTNCITETQKITGANCPLANDSLCYVSDHLLKHESRPLPASHPE